MDGLIMKYFVLNPTKRDAYGSASREALLKYAEVIERENQELATDLRQWEQRIRDGFLEEAGYLPEEKGK
jgi:hypothetical protein